MSVRQVSAQTFTFGAAGDFANGSNFKATVAQMKANNVDFSIALGDLAYTTAEASWCGAWASAGVNNLMLLPGNHDTGESSSGNINTYISNCPTMNIPTVGTYGKQYYWDYPATNPIARFISISPGLGGSFVGLDTNYKVGSQGYTFTANAIDDARAKGIKWIVVSMHKNYISIMEKGNELGADLIPMLINKRVDLVLQGHEHSYERSKQLTCAKVNSFDPTCVANATDSMVKGAGTIIHVIGTGGQGLRGMNTGDSEFQYFKAYDITTYGFGKFTVSASQLSFQFVRSAGGNFTDSFTISNSGTVPTTPPNPTSVPNSPIPTLIPPSTTLRPSIAPTIVPSLRPQTPTSGPSQIPTNTLKPINPTSTLTPQPCAISTSSMDSITMKTGPLVTGNYAIWTRMMSLSDSANSYYLQIDRECPFVVGDSAGMPTNSWEWVNFREGNPLNKIVVPFTSGDHTIKLMKKEAGVKIDEILLLSNVLCTPTGYGDNCNSIISTPIPALPTISVLPSVIISSTPFVSPIISPVIPTSVFSTPKPSVFVSPKPTNKYDEDDDDKNPPSEPTARPNGSIELIPSHDATVVQARPSSNYKSDTVLEVSGGSKKETYLKFDLRNVSLSRVHSAKLQFTIVGGSTDSQELYFINNTSWGERIITWNTRPNVSRQKIAGMNGGVAGKTVEVDLTQFIKSRAGKVTSIVITQSGNDEFTFYSEESSKGRPTLIIN